MHSALGRKRHLKYCPFLPIVLNLGVGGQPFGWRFLPNAECDHSETFSPEVWHGSTCIKPKKSQFQALVENSLSAPSHRLFPIDFTNYISWARIVDFEPELGTATSWAQKTWNRAKPPGAKFQSDRIPRWGEIAIQMVALPPLGLKHRQEWAILQMAISPQRGMRSL